MPVLAPAVLAALLAAGGASAPRAQPASSLAPTPAERRAAGRITAAAIRADGRFLASDLLEGRAPGTRGDALAEAYVAARLEALGLEPAAPGGGFLQEVPLVGVTSTVEAPLAFSAGDRSFAPARQEYVAGAGVPRARVALEAADVVFVGYGIVAPEYAWDDYAGADVRGKVVVVMNDDPADDPAIFGGKARLYYGRWTYKYEEAARHGAAGAVVIHTDRSASYPWTVVESSFSGEQLELPGGDAPRLLVRLWATEDACRRLAALGGHDLDALRAAAERRGFRAVPLGVKASIGLSARIVRTASANVLARLPGSDPRRAGEAVLYTAHHDHLGMRAGAAPGTDAIWNGAVDNASGVAALLAIARAFAALPAPPPRSVVFAAVAAEEQGTLGAEWLARHPPVPAGRLAAEVNLDAMNVLGRTRDVTVVGLGKSTLDDVVGGVAAWQGRTVHGDAFPDRGSYYRSDHFPLARIGVPAVYAGGGIDFIGRPEGWGVAEKERWAREHYHRPSDEWQDGWDLSGAVEDARLLFLVGAKVAAAREAPRWRPGDEFEAARRRALEAAGAAP